MKWERLGPYRIEERIGRGGMGTVYAAVTDVTGERTAVKVLSASHGNEEGFHDRFAAEIDSLRMLHHPNIVRILGYGEEQECRYYVMELVDGFSLQQMLDSGQRLSWQQAVRIGVQICRALKHAHDHGIIHRDIKPANLMLTGDGVIKLSDFGIAKLFGNSGQTADGGVIGTAEYMAPEQADGRPATYRSDLYSLGGVLYALLAGRPPFRAKSLIEMLQLQRFAEPEPVIRLNATVPRALNDLVSQLLQKDPTKRTPTALVAARQLESMLAYDQAVSASLQGKREALPDIPLADAPKHMESVAPSPASSQAAAADESAQVEAPAPVIPSHLTQAAPGTMPAGEQAPDLRFSLAGAESEPAPAAGPADDAAGGEEVGANGATADFRVISPLPLARPAGAAAKPNVDRSMGMSIARTYTPVSKDDRRRASDDGDVETPWISPATWGLVFAMLTIGLLARYWLQPPAAEKLYEQIAEAAAQGKAERLIDVESQIHSFLDHYPADRRVREMQAYLEEIDVYRIERRLEFRAKFLSKNEGLTPVERMYFEAVGYLRLDPELGRKKLQALVDLFRDSKDGSKQTRDCLQLAQKQLDRLDRQLPQQASADRKLLEQRLAEAERLQASDPDAARRIREAVVELYAQEPWAESLVAKARALNAKYAAGPKPTAGEK